MNIKTIPYEIHERDLSKPEYQGRDWIFENGDWFVLKDGAQIRIVPDPPLSPVPVVKVGEGKVVRITKLDGSGKPLVEVKGPFLASLYGGAPTVTGAGNVTPPPVAPYEVPRVEVPHPNYVRAERERKLQQMAEQLNVPPFLKNLKDVAVKQWITQEDRLRPKKTCVQIPYPEFPNKEQWQHGVLAHHARWIAPAQPVYDNGLQKCGSSCKLNSDSATAQAEFPDWAHLKACRGIVPQTNRQEEGHISMYTDESQRIAAQRLIDERNQREADEIITRTKAFGEDQYADGTVFRFKREYYKNVMKTMTYPPETFTVLRYTDEFGTVTWTSSNGCIYRWCELVSWFVTGGKPITLADIEIFPPAGFVPDTVFPAESGTVVETTITGTAQ